MEVATKSKATQIEADLLKHGFRTGFPFIEGEYAKNHGKNIMIINASDTKIQMVTFNGGALVSGYIVQPNETTLEVLKRFESVNAIIQATGIY